MTTFTFEQLPLAVTQLYEKLDKIEELLLNNKNIAGNEKDKLLTLQQTVEFLSLSKPTIYKLVSDAKIPVSKKGRRLYFFENDLANWVKEGKKPTISEIEGQASSYLINLRGRS